MIRAYDTSHSPFPVGESPFRAKGVIFSGTQQFFSETVPGGLDALLQQLGPGPLADFIGQRFLVSSYYDALTIPTLIRAEADACGLGMRVYMQRRTKWQAERDIGGIYRLLLKVTSPETVVPRLPKLLTQMLNFSKVTTVVGDHEATSEVTGFPEVLVPWLSMAMETYTRVALVLAGAKSADSEVVSMDNEGIDRGVRMVKVVLRGSWQ